MQRSSQVFFRTFVFGLSVAIPAASQAPYSFTQISGMVPGGRAALPDSPGAMVRLDLVDAAGDLPNLHGAGRTPRRLALTIQPGQDAPRWGTKEKFEAALVKEASIGGIFSAATSAGWAQLRDGRPHYGDDEIAYGQRFGASLARQTSQSFFYAGVFSSVLRDDPRYYVLGQGHPFKKRVFYAASSVFVIRKDSGGNTANIPLWLGVTASQALSNTYYPDADRQPERTLASAGSSLLIRMATQQFKEFSGDMRQKVHLNR